MCHYDCSCTVAELGFQVGQAAVYSVRMEKDWLQNRLAHASFEADRQKSHMIPVPFEIERTLDQEDHWRHNCRDSED